MILHILAFESAEAAKDTIHNFQVIEGMNVRVIDGTDHVKLKKVNVPASDSPWLAASGQNWVIVIATKAAIVAPARA